MDANRGISSNVYEYGHYGCADQFDPSDIDARDPFGYHF